MKQTVRPTTLLESLFGDDFMNNAGFGTGIDIYRESGNYHVDIEMPGFEKEDIDVEFSGDILSIKAEHRTSEEKEEKNYFYRSRNQKSVKRQIRFADVDANAIDATYERGILSITLPTKVEEQLSNKISVK
ncbi:MULTISPECIES: Hsp20/alpha crystallin family protein [Erysipelothrix]|uniref:Hsp20/alpha crystallin family protein n=1 Tax=Erysipelothrix piscisicarius TaxID=2485784 RepID=A0A3S8RNT7_9FIRM|nr:MULTISPECIES: Hsp20/alpha crystallin family protein [Erysipelothrix]AZK44591.1 Hsp20/alpha crystallin family protein [Erysipelothrix piscisicarius]MBK2401894.1 Hsp20 family protein [Erysipelothrix sp. strain 2 (EsS2-6-Brazil)]NBA00982.1 Hsp20 family protein [Erysipelothrix rhusiopathiae]